MGGWEEGRDDWVDGERGAEMAVGRAKLAFFSEVGIIGWLVRGEQGWL